MTTSTLTVTDFVLARIAEDEEMAHAAAPHFPGEVEIVSEVWEDAVAHIAHNDPARVMAQCAAMRKIMELHWENVHGDNCKFCGHADDRDPGDGWPCTTLRILASIWSDHPDFQEAWRA